MTELPDTGVRVSAEWVDAHRREPGVRLVEVDAYNGVYERGHVPGAVDWSWATDLWDTGRGDIPTRADFSELMARAGIDHRTRVVLYGDDYNWFAAWAYWLLRAYRHPGVQIMDGGRRRWLEEGRAVTTAVPVVPRTGYEAPVPDPELRDYLHHTRATMEAALRSSWTALARRDSAVRRWPDHAEHPAERTAGSWLGRIATR